MPAHPTIFFVPERDHSDYRAPGTYERPTDAEAALILALKLMAAAYPKRRAE